MAFQDRLNRVLTRKREELTVHDLGAPAAVLLIFLFGFWIRAIPADSMRYLQALDPYMIARMSEAIITQHHLPMIDMWRYFPFGTPTYELGLGNIFIPAYLYHLAQPYGVSFLAYAKLVPAFFGALMAVTMYFIGKEAFDKYTGVAAAFFLAATAAILHRSSAGWYEKEPIGGLFMLLTMYFFLRAWTRNSWPAGILAGVSLAIAKTAWGGTAFLFLFLPIVTFFVLFIDEDTEALLRAFTPTFLLGLWLAVILNPSRTSPTGTSVLLGAGVLALLWLRYLVERAALVSEGRLPYVIPAASGAGFIMLLLSPLYSQYLARNFFKLFTIASKGGPYGVIGGTVAENAPAGINQILSQLGAVSAVRVLPPYMAVLTRVVDGWHFAMIGMAALFVITVLMLARKYSERETLQIRIFFFAIPAVLLLVALVAGLVSGPNLAFSFFIGFLLAFVAAIFLSLYPTRDSITIPQQWHLILILLWALTTVYGVTQRSRLMFLAAQPVALMAGYAVVNGIAELRRSEVWAAAAAQSEELDASRIFTLTVVLILFPVVVVNAASAYGMANSIGGSPNQLWLENLNYMREETPVDSVMLSWWDYGYWFESIGGRAAIADGGNLAFYRTADVQKVNYPLADFLTAENYTQHLPWLEQLSVDYVILDSSMIGKYSAVSQIHNRDNSQFTAMQTFNCQRTTRTIGGQQRQVCQQRRATDNQTYLIYNAARGTQFLVPVRQDSQIPSGPPLLRTPQGTTPVANFCSTQGIIQYTSGDQATVPGCVAWHPYRRHTQLIYIPEQAMRSTLVRLYVMDGAGMPEFEKVPSGSNGYVKMWRVDTS